MLVQFRRHSIHEALLAVSWGEPSVLQQQLEEHSTEIFQAPEAMQKPSTDLLQLALSRQR